MWRSLVAHLVWDQRAAGSNPVIPTTSKQSSLCFDFFIQKSHPPASLLLLFRKKSRSANLFGCKRPHDGSLSLPTFCEFIVSYKSSFGGFFCLVKTGGEHAACEKKRAMKSKAKRQNRLGEAEAEAQDPRRITPQVTRTK